MRRLSYTDWPVNLAKSVMSSSSLAIDIDKISGGARVSQEDSVAVEEPLEIQIGAESAGGSAAKSISVTMRTPGNDVELALGFLLSESIISGTGDVESAEHVGAADADTNLRNTVRIQLKPDVDVDFARLERHFYTTSSCGVCGKTSLAALRVVAPQAGKSAFALNRETLIDLPDKLRREQRVFGKTGGLHAAAAFDSGGELIVVREDVGRHNAVDKVVGALFARGALPAAELGLLVSGRASFELMQKTLVAGMPMLAAVGAPSSLAVRLAREFDLALVGFLRGADFNIYSGATRVI